MLRAILALLNVRKNKILLVAEAALPERQYVAFKKVFLDELGMRGLEAELIELINSGESNNSGMEMGRKILCTKGGAEMIENRTNT